MVVWPAVTLIGFLALVAFVIAMGTSSTARYEAEKQASSRPRPRHGAPEPVSPAMVLQDAA
jgi:hypothetical protein